MTDDLKIRATRALTRIRLAAGPDAAYFAEEEAKQAALAAAHRVHDERLIELADELAEPIKYDA